MGAMIVVGDHYRSTGESVPPGIYRVVGIPHTVTLLQVADADGRRRHTGNVVSVEPERLEREFDPAEEPTAGLDPGRLVLGPIRNLYWSVYAAWLSVRRRLS